MVPGDGVGYDPGMSPDVDTLPEDPVLLRAMVLGLRAEIAGIAAANRAYEALVQALRITIARLKKQRFGASSEKIEREIEQLELALESLETARAAADQTPEAEAPEGGDAAPDTVPPQRRRGKPRIAEDAPRERIVLDPGERCPDCGGALRLVGEDVAEILEFIAAKLKVVEIHRPKKSCRDCERMVQTAAPPRPIRRGMAGPALLAHILVAKYDDQLPLYRQGEIFARMGADIPRATLIDWCGQAAGALRPLVDVIRDVVVASDRIHADDTPIPVLDPRKKRIEGLACGVKEGRIWVYVKDDRPWAGGDPPAAAYWFSPDHKGEHPRAHLADFNGILQADAYAGFKDLYEPGADGTARVREAACWAHLRRDFHDVWKATDSPIAREALERIGALYDIEAAINGQPRDVRHAVRQKQSRPKVEAFRLWCERQLTRIPGKGDLAKAMRYALNRWDSFALFLDDARVAIDNNAAERAIKPIVLGRKNFLFAGSDAGGEILAEAMTVIETAKLSGLNPEAYLTDILGRIRTHDPRRLDDLLPWNWKANRDASPNAA
jgi:transposase